MSPRKRRSEPAEDTQATGACAALFDSRGRLEALEAARGWAARIVLAAATGDRADVTRGAIGFLMRFFDGKRLDDSRNRLRQALERKAPDFAPYVDKLLLDYMAAIEGAALMLGIAVGQMLRVDVAEVKAARVQQSLDVAGVKGEVEARRRQLGRAPYDWQCDDSR